MLRISDKTHPYNAMLLQILHKERITLILPSIYVYIVSYFHLSVEAEVLIIRLHMKWLPGWTLSFYI